MKEKIEKFDQAMAVAYKYELHAFVLLITGATMCLFGHKEEGMLVLGAAMAVFKGKAGQ